MDEPFYLVTPVVAEGLSLHSGPGEDFPVVGTAVAGDVLEIIEVGETALAKLGLKNQWVQVRSVHFVHGFVAAWQVQRAYRSPAPSGVNHILPQVPAPQSESPAPEPEPVEAVPEDESPVNPVEDVPASSAPVEAPVPVDEIDVLDEVEPEPLPDIPVEDDVEPPVDAPVPPPVLDVPSPIIEDVPARSAYYVCPTVPVLRVRTSPGRQYEATGVVTWHDRLEVSDPDAAQAAVGIEGAWVQIHLPGGGDGWAAAQYLEFAPEIIPSPVGHALAGIHGPADPDAWAWDDAAVSLVSQARMDAVKLLSGHDIDRRVVDRLRGAGARFVLTRLFGKFNEPRSPQSFADEVSPVVAQLIDAGCRYFEVHNEPNLCAPEGMWSAWQNGAEFGEFFLAVRDILKPRFPDALVGWPGVSPGAALVGPDGQQFRYDADRFLSEADFAVQQADFVCMHTYWGGDGSFYTDALEKIRRFAEAYPHKTVFVSEFSNNCPRTPKHIKGQQYARFYTEARRLPENVGALFCYVLSASSGFQHETWRGSSIPEQVGQRPD